MEKNLENNEENVVNPENKETTTPEESISTNDSNKVKIIKEEDTDDGAIVIKKSALEDEESVVDDTEEVILDLGDDNESGSAHDDFDWGKGKKNALEYSDEQIAEYTTIYEAALKSITDNDIVSARVAKITDGDVVLDLNYKSDGVVSKSEFRGQELKINDLVDVYVENVEDANGQLILSRRKAKLLRAWDNIVESYKEGKILTGTVVSKTKGGLIVDIEGLETFLPGSQIDIRPIIDYDAYVGKTMEFKVVKINESIKNAVVSHKALIESDLEAQRAEIISKLEKGQVLEGTVKNITDFGAFLDLGGVDGLLYITDISWGRIKHPSDILELNQKINVVVLDFDDNKKRISLGLKQLQSHPWDVIGEEITEGSVVNGKIVNIEDYGAFLEIKPGVEGLIHVSEVSWSNQPINAREFFKLGTNYDAKVVTLDREGHKMSLSLKQLSADPWNEIETKYAKGTKHEGVVKNLTPYGVFVELEEGIGGMIHISDLSWTKRFNHPSEYTKVTETIAVTIEEIDKDSRKLSLGHKQLEENPWDTFENVFPVGSYHEATIIRADDRGAIVSLPYGLEAFAPIRHIKKEDNTTAVVDDVLMFKVLEFNRDDKRILVSHTRYLQDIKREADGEERAEKVAQVEKTRKAVKKTQSKVEKTTLGELSAFSQLKEQLKAEEADSKDKKAPKEDKTEE